VDPTVVVMQLLLGGILGMTGQGARVIVGLKKVYEEAGKKRTSFAEEFSPSTLIVSLIIGFVAGVLAFIGIAGLDAELVDQQQMLATLGAGYAGTDFIEGFMKRTAVPAQAPGVKRETGAPGVTITED